MALLVRPRAWPSRWLLGDTVKEDWRAYMEAMGARFKARVERAE